MLRLIKMPVFDFIVYPIFTRWRNAWSLDLGSLNLVSKIFFSVLTCILAFHPSSLLIYIFCFIMSLNVLLSTTAYSQFQGTQGSTQRKRNISNHSVDYIKALGCCCWWTSSALCSACFEVALTSTCFVFFVLNLVSPLLHFPWQPQDQQPLQATLRHLHHRHQVSLTWMC